MYLLSAMDRASDWGMKMNTEYQVGLLVISCLFGLFLERWYLSRRHTSNADAPRVRSSVAQALLTVVNTNQNVRIIWNPSASEVAVISRNPVGEGCLSEMRIPIFQWMKFCSSSREYQNQNSFSKWEHGLIQFWDKMTVSRSNSSPSFRPFTAPPEPRRALLRRWMR